jgi:hypothetical protein
MRDFAVTNRDRRRLLACSITVLLCLFVSFAQPSFWGSAAAAQSAPQLSVGYVDGNVGLTPWAGTPNTVFSGTSSQCCATHGQNNGANGWDSAALLISNPASSPLTISAVSVDFGSAHIALWPANQSVPATGSLVMTMTNGFNFDGSDFATEVCGPNVGIVPVVHITAGGVTYDYPDTHQILNTYGTDLASCPNDISEQHNFIQIPTTGLASTSPPANVLAPTVVGLPQRSELLSTLPGAWDANPTPTLTKQWQRCSGGICTDIDGAVGANYVPTSADVGYTLRALWSGSNPVGTSSNASAETTVIADGPAVGRFGNTDTGNDSTYQWQQLKFGSIFTAAEAGTSTAFRFYARGGGFDQQFVPAVYSVVNGSPGTLLGKGTVTTVPKGAAGTWWRSTLAGIPLTAGTNYMLALLSNGTPGVATYLNFDPGTNAGFWNTNTYPTPSSSWGTINKENRRWSFALDYTPSVVTAPPPPTPPVNAVLPAVTGTAQQGSTLTAASGTWTGSVPIVYSYQWQSCAASCTPVSGATGQTYIPTAADVGSTLAVAVTATNTAGNAIANSAASAVVTAAPAPTPPVNAVLPAVTGTAQQGSTLTAASGTWTGSVPIVYSYQWQSCAASCTPVSGATGQTYIPTAADVGSTLAVAVTATNTAGNATANSAASPTITAAPTTTTFGATTPGSSFTGTGTGYKLGTIVTAPAAGTVTTFRFYAAGGTTDQKFTPAVYAVTNGTPGALLARGQEITIRAGQAAGWITSTLPTFTLNNGTSYLIALVVGTTTNSAHVYYDTTTNAGFWNTNTYPTPSTTWGTINKENRRWSFALDYTPSVVTA